MGVKHRVSPNTRARKLQSCGLHLENCWEAQEQTWEGEYFQALIIKSMKSYLGYLDKKLQAVQEIAQDPCF